MDMNNKKIWVSDSMADPSIVQNLTFLPRKSDPSHGEELLRLADVQKKYRNGVGLASRDVFSKAFGIYKDKNVGILPDLFSVNGILVVSERFKGVVERFDLGKTDFVRLSIYEWDRQTLVTGGWFVLSFGCRKGAFNPLESRGNFRPYNKKTNDRWSVLILQDDDIAVSDISIGGCDLWTDEKLTSAFFMSDDLKTALDNNGLSTSVRLHRCLIVSSN